MKKLKYILATTFLLFVASSCNLDVDMYNSVIAEKLDARNIDKAHRGSYELLKHNSGIVRHGAYFSNLGADDLAWNSTSSGTTFYFYDYSRNINNTETEYGWELAYRTIGSCNDIIVKVDEFFGSNLKTDHKLLKGESFYIRALCYFLLVNEFAQPYSNNPDKNPGLPLKLDNNSDRMAVPKKRSTVAEVYNQIVLDLTDAIDLMTLPAGTDPKSNIYATKEAAEALLARVYLYMGKYDEAYELADKVIKSGRFELESGEKYATYPQIIPENNKETIFAIRQTLNKDTDDGIGSLFIRVDNSGWEEISASSRYLELLELHHDSNDMPKDLRRRFVRKRYVEDGVEDYSISEYANKQYKTWWFAYASKQAGDNAHYEYERVMVEKNEAGEFIITKPEDVAKFKKNKIESESYNLGKRYFVTSTNGEKHIGRIEPEVFDASTKRGKDGRFLVYSINKSSYQEQRKHLYSTVVSRLSEMYLIRAEINAINGKTQNALDDVNIIRKRAGIPEWTVANMQTAENGQPKSIEKIVEEERILELAWEGHRRYDIFRKKGTLDRRYPGAHTLKYGDKYISVPYNSPSVCEFIPQKQFDNYPYSLEQNP